MLRRPSRLPPVALVLGLLAPAAAIAAPPGLPSPAPAVPLRSAADVSPSPSLASWLEGEGRGFFATVDPRTGTAHRLVGPGLRLDRIPLAEQDAADAAISVLDAHRVLLGSGVSADELTIDRVHHDGRTWTVTFERRIDGVRVVNAQAEVRMRGDRVILLAFDTFPGVEVDTAPTLTAADADAAVDAALAGPWTVERVGEPELVIVPIDDGAGVTGRLAWAIEARTGAPDWGVWYVDAHTGETVAYEQRLRYGFVGSVHATIDTRYPGSGTTDAPLPYLDLGAVLTAADGTVDVAEGLAADVTMAGRWVRVRDQGGSAYRAAIDLTASSPDAVLSPTSSDLAELDAYAFTNVVHARAVAIAPENSWAQSTVTANVNINSACNAYFDGSSINFYKEGSGCNNTARIADVVFHEYGHGFHYYGIVSGSYDYAMGEGAADYLAATITNSTVIGPGFYTSGGGIRDIGPNAKYPDDLYGQPHYDGLIYGSTMWDLRAALIDKYGEGPGVRRADQLFYATIRGADGMTDAYVEVLLEADDDGDLTNGVLDGCEIRDVFERHGLARGADVVGGIELYHQPPAGNTDTVELSATARRGQCGGDPISGVTAHVVGTDGAEQAVPMSLDGDRWTAPLDGASGPVRYYLTATDGVSTVRLPSGDETFRVHVGAVDELYCMRFESGFGDWTHGAVSLDPEVRGLDEWEIGAPEGLYGDPTDPYGGDQVAGLDLGGAGDGDGLYEPMIDTWLESPAIDVGDRDGVRLQFWRKLAVEDAAYDQARVVVNGEEVWANDAVGDGVFFEDAGWVFHEVDLGRPGTVQVRFELTSDAGFDLGGWTIDDVCFVAPSTGKGGAGESDGGRTPRGDVAEAEMTLTGCGCATGAPAPVWLGVFGLVFVRRRRA